MAEFRTDQALWYKNGVWGDLGYAAPNCGDNTATLNAGIAYLVSAVGRNLFAVMHHKDADLCVPPSINTLTRIHKLVIRARTILGSREVLPGKPQMEAGHVSPAPQDFLLFPVPFFRVRNPWLAEYCGLTLNAIADAMQDTENRAPYDFTTAFSGRVGQYLGRIYKLMSVELFQVPLATAQDPAFILTDAMLAGYNPANWFSSTEMVDTAPPVSDTPTEDDLAVLRAGIPASQIVGLVRWPTGTPEPGAIGASASGATAAATASVPPFQAPPGP